MYLDDLKKADINISSSGDNTIIAAPGEGKYLAIDFVTALPTTGVTVQIKSGTTNYGGPLPLDAKQPFTFENVMGHERGVITCANNEAFVLNLSSGVQVGGFVRYRIMGQ